MKDVTLLLRDIMMGLGFILWVVIRVPLKLCGAAGRTVRARSHRRPDRLALRSESVAQVQVSLPAALPKPDLAEQGPVTVMQTSPYEVADRIVGIRLDPPVGTINLRVYRGLAVVKRDLIISEPRLKAMLRGRRHGLPDVPYDPVKGLDATKEETIRLAEKMINEVGNQAVSALRPPRDTHLQKSSPKVTKAAPEGGGTAAPQPPRQAAQPAEQREPMAARATVFEPRPTAGITYEGRLIRAGLETVRPKDRAEYEVFEATLLLDNGATLPLRGAELERELISAGCEVGHRICVTPMGKVPVTLADGGEAKKNLYRVRNMSAAQHSGQYA